MKKEYFNMSIYDVYFFDKIIERGTELYLSNKIINLEKKNNKYSCKIQGSSIYEVNIIFKDFDKDYIRFKYNNPSYIKEIEVFKEQMDSLNTTYKNILQNNKRTNDII